eukprot:TRINITY_DN9176_c0_g2_i2.p1 TRINITY_DN9176_c0_g2~~TRINITY_DN9176_c0_g2_i2.p1  ORF type:complete len:246 (-),score=24.72 TRINITY_DN9176_c0_g2_i2:269-937(-)
MDQSVSLCVLRALLGGLTNAFIMLFSNPLDVLKIRFQLGGEGAWSPMRTQSTVSKAKSIVRREGLRGLYKGISISMIRELTFSSGRVGLYEPIKFLLRRDGHKELSGVGKLCAGLISGAVSAAIFNPTDVIKIRFQGDTSAKGEPRRYASICGAVHRIIREEGIRKGLYKGVLTTTLRSSILSATQISSYDTIKHQVLFKYFLHYFPTESFQSMFFLPYMKF